MQTNTAEIVKNIGRGKNTPLLWNEFESRIIIIHCWVVKMPN